MPQSSFLSTAFLQPQNYKLLFQWTLLFQWHTSPCISHKKPAFHIKSLSVLLDPYCEIETYAMDKKTGICTVEGTALSVNSIPNTGFLSYPRRTGYETVIHTFPVTMKTSLLSVQKKTPLIGYHLLPSMYTHTMKIHLTLKVTIITPLQQLTIPKTLFITLSFQIQKKI